MDFQPSPRSQDVLQCLQILNREHIECNLMQSAIRDQQAVPLFHGSKRAEGA